MINPSNDFSRYILFSTKNSIVKIEKTTYKFCPTAKIRITLQTEVCKFLKHY